MNINCISDSLSVSAVLGIPGARASLEDPKDGARDGCCVVGCWGGGLSEWLERLSARNPSTHAPYCTLCVYDVYCVCCLCSATCVSTSCLFASMCPCCLSLCCLSSFPFPSLCVPRQELETMGFPTPQPYLLGGVLWSRFLVVGPGVPKRPPGRAQCLSLSLSLSLSVCSFLFPCPSQFPVPSLPCPLPLRSLRSFSSPMVSVVKHWVHPMSVFFVCLRRLLVSLVDHSLASSVLCLLYFLRLHFRRPRHRSTQRSKRLVAYGWWNHMMMSRIVLM